MAHVHRGAYAEQLSKLLHYTIQRVKKMCAPNCEVRDSGSFAMGRIVCYMKSEFGSVDIDTQNDKTKLRCTNKREEKKSE